MEPDTAELRGEKAAFSRMHGYYINIDRGLLALLKQVREKSGPLGIIERGAPLLALRLRKSAVYTLCAIAWRFLSARLKRRLGYQKHRLSLPDYGELAVLCFPDFIRVFDLESEQIHNMCRVDDARARQRFARVMEYQKRLSEIDVAPRILRQSPQGDHYVEEYCRGTRMRSAKWWDWELFESVRCRIEELQSVWTRGSCTIGEVKASLESAMAIPSGKDSEPRMTLYNWLVKEIDKVCESLDPDTAVELTLSHGDLGRANTLLREDDSVVFIDWQTVDFRMRNYDLYSYYFDIAQRADDADVMSETELYERLLSALGVRTRDDAINGMLTYSLFFHKTRLEHFLSGQHAENVRLKKVLHRTKTRKRFLERYRMYCESALLV